MCRSSEDGQMQGNVGLYTVVVSTIQLCYINSRYLTYLIWRLNALMMNIWMWFIAYFESIVYCSFVKNNIISLSIFPDVREHFFLNTISNCGCTVRLLWTVQRNPWKHARLNENPVSRHCTSQEPFARCRLTSVVRHVRLLTASITLVNIYERRRHAQRSLLTLLRVRELAAAAAAAAAASLRQQRFNRDQSPSTPGARGRAVIIRNERN